MLILFIPEYSTGIIENQYPPGISTSFLRYVGLFAAAMASSMALAFWNSISKVLSSFGMAP